MFSSIGWLSAVLLAAAIWQAVEGARPEFVDMLQNLTVPIGRDATFTCQVQNLGGYRVGWVKADTKAIQAIHTHVITHNPRVRVSHRDQTTWNLHINSVQEEDRGTYMCQINYSPMMSQYGLLNVVVPPDIVSSESTGDLTIPEGGSGELRCSARGYPEPTIQWRREDGRKISVPRRDANGNVQEVRVNMYEGEVLPLLKVKRSDTGFYLCIASNGLPPSVSKKIKVEVHFHPVVQVQHQLHGVPLGSDVTLRCHVEALPKSINYWNKKPEEMLLPSRKYNISEEKDSVYSLWMALTIRDFEVQDAGQYLCTAKNSIGEVQSEIRVYEIRLSPKPGITLVEDTADDITYSSPEEGPPPELTPSQVESGDLADVSRPPAREPGPQPQGSQVDAASTLFIPSVSTLCVTSALYAWYRS